jgi:hypothetical protein
MGTGGMGGVIYSSDRRGSSEGNLGGGVGQTADCCESTSRENRMTNQDFKTIRRPFWAAIVGDTKTAWTTHQHPRQAPRRA